MRKLLIIVALAAAQMGAQNASPANAASEPKQDTVVQKPNGPTAAPPKTPASAEGAQVTPLFRSNTHLVQLNVIARAHGQAVTDLKKENFHLFDNGKEQKISVFSVESSGKLPSSPVKLPPNVYTNKLIAKPGTPQSVTVILLDTFNTKMEDQMFARQQVVKFLLTIKPEDRVALYVLGNGLKVLHDYTTDSTDLLRALNQFGDGKQLPDMSQNQPMSLGTDMINLNQWMMGGGSGAEQDFYMVNRVQNTLRTIEFIANHLSKLPGRKNLIWVSGGFPLTMGFDDIETFNDPSREHRTFNEEITRTVKAVNDANVAIYPVDARGLVADGRFSAANQKVDLAPKLSMGPIVENQQTMSEIASRTGGKAYYNTNDLKHAIRDAIDDASTTYTLGFYPDDEKYDGKFHTFKVKVEGRGGMDVRYRKGYFDFQDKPADEKVRQAEIRDAVWSPLDSSALGVVVQTRRTDKPAPNSMEMIVYVDPTGIGLTPKGDRMSGKIDVFFVQKNDRGREFNGKDDGIDLNLSKANYETMMHNGFSYHQVVPLVAQATQLRIIVRDNASGTIGSVTIPLKSAQPAGLIKR